MASSLTRILRQTSSFSTPLRPKFTITSSDVKNLSRTSSLLRHSVLSSAGFDRKNGKNDMRQEKIRVWGNGLSAFRSEIACCWHKFGVPGDAREVFDEMPRPENGANGGFPDVGFVGRDGFFEGEKIWVRLQEMKNAVPEIGRVSENKMSKSDAFVEQSLEKSSDGRNHLNAARNVMLMKNFSFGSRKNALFESRGFHSVSRKASYATLVPSSSKKSKAMVGKKSKAMATKNTEITRPKKPTTIAIKIKSFESPFMQNEYLNLPRDTRKIGLPDTRRLYTVLRSPHIDKKSREQFEMRTKRMLYVMKVDPKDLQHKFFWLKRMRVFGAQFEIKVSCKTRLDQEKLQSLLEQKS